MIRLEQSATGTKYKVQSNNGIPILTQRNKQKNHFYFLLNNHHHINYLEIIMNRNVKFLYIYIWGLNTPMHPTFSKILIFLNNQKSHFTYSLLISFIRYDSVQVNEAINRKLQDCWFRVQKKWVILKYSHFQLLINISHQVQLLKKSQKCWFWAQKLPVSLNLGKRFW